VTEEQSGLLAKAADSIHAAELMARDGLHDFAVSRAYYAMFYAAEALLLGHDLRFKSHAGVISAFGSEFAKPGLVSAELHHFLIDAQDSRIQGDYEIGPTQSADDAAFAIGHAQVFLAEARRLVS
jgi:uncharacterized protein (UPF0332 family)